MRHILELLICSTIGIYCLLRCASLAPAAIAEAHAVMAAAFDRQRRIEEVLDPEGD
jgi:hypothetical protein